MVVSIAFLGIKHLDNFDYIAEMRSSVFTFRAMTCLVNLPVDLTKTKARAAVRSDEPAQHTVCKHAKYIY